MKKAQYKKSTGELLEVIKNNPLDKTIEEIHEEQLNISLREYLNGLIAEHGSKPSDVMKKAGLTKSYFYALIDGTRVNPSRDILIRLCFGFELSLDETQKLLKTFGAAVLYPRSRRDSIIIHAIENKLTLEECNDNLHAYGQKTFVE